MRPASVGGFLMHRSSPLATRLTLGLVGVAAAAILCLPASAAASTQPEASLPPCDIGVSTVVAGTPLELSGTMSIPAEGVAISARSETGEFREGTVATVGDQWHGVIIFGAADSGTWTVEIGVDGARCASRLTVTLPAGVIPPTRAPVAQTTVEPVASGIDGDTIRSVAAVGVAAVVVASWILLPLLALSSVLGARPLARRSLLVLARGATFAAVLGGFVTAGLTVYIGIGFSHMSSGIPSDQKAILDMGLWGVVIVGVVAATLAARRVASGPPAGDRRAAS
jgi:hypothetical protein